jgi:hypothetical protein
MEHPRWPSTESKEDISLKDLILKLQEWSKYLLSKFLIIALFGIIGAILGGIYAWMQKPKYVGELTFVLEEGNKSGGLGAYAGLASQFGVDLGGMSGGSGIFAGDNIIEFLKSRLMVEKALLSPISVDGKEKSLADLYIDFNELRKSWEKDTAAQKIYFPVNPDRRKFTLKQDSILNIFFLSILKNNLVIEKPDKKLNFVAVKCISKNEIFSKVFTEHLVKEATAFYVNTKTMRSKSNVDKLQMKADSIEDLLNKKTYSAALAQDLNMNPARNIASVGSEVVTRDKMVLQTMYGEVIKNLELSKMSMSQETPIIQIVDTPILPLQKLKLGRLKGLIIGGLLGSFMIVIVLMIKKIYKEVME